MNLNNKIIALLLLLPMLMVNFPSGMADLCQTSARTGSMNCCSAKHLPLNGTSLNSKECGCQIADSQPAHTASAVLSQISKPGIEKLGDYFVTQRPLRSAHFCSFLNHSHRYFPLKASSHLKIYDLVSSYLI